MEGKLLTKEQFATKLKKCTRQLDRYVKAGKYSPHRVGIRMMFPESQLPRSAQKKGVADEC